MEIKTTTLRKIVKVTFPGNIDYHKLAVAVGARDATVWNWLKTGKVPEQYLEKIKNIELKTVLKDK